MLLPFRRVGQRVGFACFPRRQVMGNSACGEKRTQENCDNYFMKTVLSLPLLASEGCAINANKLAGEKKLCATKWGHLR